MSHPPGSRSRLDRVPRLGAIGALVGLALLSRLIGCSAPATAPGTRSAAAPEAATASSAAAGAAPAVGAGPAVAPTASAAGVEPLQPSVPVKVGVFGTVSDSGFFIALERGYAAAEGIDLELVPFNSSPQLLAPLATGQIAVGVGAANPGLYNAISRGVALKIVADRGSAPPESKAAGIMVRRPVLDAGFRDFADLRGRTVAIQARGISGEVVLGRMLQLGGLAESDINLVELPFADQVPALANGAIDVGSTVEPFITEAERRGAARLWKTTGEVYPNQQFAVVSYSPLFVDQQPEAARRLMVAYLRAVRAYNDAFEKNVDRSGIVAILTKHTSIADPVVFDQMYPTPLNPDGYVNVESLRADLAWFADHGYIPDPPNLDRVIDLSYVDYAMARLGPYQR